MKVTTFVRHQSIRVVEYVSLIYWLTGPLLIYVPSRAI